MGILLILAFIFIVIALIKAPAFNINDVSPDSYYTTVLDDEGNEMVKLQGEAANREYVTVDNIADSLEQAVIDIEDVRFYKHHGVDLRGIIRALWADITSASVEQGASTITQQLVKNNVLTGWTEEQNIFDKVERKIQEIYLSIRVENKVSKTWILENYLNTVNMGSGCWGVETASECYFGKDVSELTISESAVLAAIIQSPTYNNPLEYPENNAKRRQAVLESMVKQGDITEAQMQEALTDDVYTRIKQNYSFESIDVLSYFEDELVKQVVNDLQEKLGYSEENAWQYVYRGGLTINSTQNTAIQTYAENAVNNSSLYGSEAQAAAVVMDPSKGYVKAIVGGRGEKTASLTYDRATESTRQPGSTIKIIGEYSAALDTGEATLATTYDNAPTTYSNGTPIKNASTEYTGMTTVREGIIHSINVVALKCLQDVGVDKTYEYLEKYGLSHLTSSDKVEAMAIGGLTNGVTPLEMTAAYSAIANDGQYIEPTFYTTVTDRNGVVILTSKQEKHRVIKDTTAHLLTLAMEDVMTQGTGTPAAFSGTDLAGKSGTTDGSKDLWFVGFSPKLCCGVWGGFDDNSEQSSTGYVKSIWKSIMSQAVSVTGSASFDASSGLTRATICKKCGRLAVDGLCDDTVQGDMTQVEYFATGTAPTADCTCHEEVTICNDSGMLAGKYCTDTTKAVYLKSGTSGTNDEAAIVPDVTEECTEHEDWWNTVVPNESEGNHDYKDAFDDFSNFVHNFW